MAKSEIIKLFAKNEIDTEVALRQLKVLLATFPNLDAASWVDKELSGYDINDELPVYRKTGGSLQCDLLAYGLIANNIGLPIRPDAPDDIRDLCNNAYFRESIGALKMIIKKDGQIAFDISPDLYPFIMKYSLRPTTSILRAKKVVSRTDIMCIITAVDKRILDILLYLEKEFGVLDNLDLPTKEKSEGDIQIIQNTILNYIYVDNSITIGDENKISDSIMTVNSQTEKGKR